MEGGRWICTRCGAEVPRGDHLFEPASFGFKPPKNYDVELADPVTLQFWQENKRHQEDLILSGDRGHDVYQVVEGGPSGLRPFGNDPARRKTAIERAGYSKDGVY